MKSISVNHRY